MRMRLRIAVAGLALLPLLPSAAAGAARVQLFTGGGYGPTAAVAVQAAIDDAVNSAASEQLYTCELVGEPQVFPRPTDPFGHVFSAEATVGCTP